jgi:hypothetical protein
MRESAKRTRSPDKAKLKINMDNQLSGSEVVILIHGVGDPPKGSLRQEAAPLVRKLGVSDDNLVEINWNDQVRKPLRDGALNLDHLSGLMRGFVGSASLIPPRSTARQIDTIAGIVSTLLQCLMLVAPIALVSLGLLLVLQACPYNVGPSATDAWAADFCRIPLIPARLIFGEQVSPFVIWALKAYGCILLLCIAMLTATRLIISQGHGLAVSLRQVMLFLLWPTIFVVAVLLSTPSVVSGLIAFQLLTLLYLKPTYENVSLGADMLLRVHTHSPWIEGALSSLSIVLLVVIARLVLRLLAPALKVFADVVCYMGDPIYTAKLQADIESTLRLYQGKVVIIVGHSLGSQIAVRALLSTNVRFAHMGLVTMGSPIRRLLVRFFPGLVVAPDEALQQLKERNPSFWWVNVYRPFDPIGTSIFRRPENVHLDVSTRQFRRVFITAHVDYWSDQTVIDNIVSTVKSL